MGVMRLGGRVVRAGGKDVGGSSLFWGLFFKEWGEKGGWVRFWYLFESCLRVVGMCVRLFGVLVVCGFFFFVVGVFVVRSFLLRCSLDRRVGHVLFFFWSVLSPRFGCDLAWTRLHSLQLCPLSLLTLC